MLPNPHILALLATTVIFTVVGRLDAVEPPERVIQKLGSEAYPERVNGERELREWAEGGGEKAKAWLLNHGRKSDDPEIRRRSMAVLKVVVIEDLTQERPGFVGISMSSVKLTGKGRSGVEIQSINPDSPADKAGLEVNDVVVKLDGKGWSKPEADEEFAARVGAKRGGDKVVLEILRSGQVKELELTLASRPWSAGLYSDRKRLADPFAARTLLLSEDEAVEEAFQSWLKGQGVE